MVDPGDGDGQRSSAEARLTLSLRFDHVLFVIEPFGELEAATEPEFAEILDRALATDAKMVLVDLSGLSLIDSFGIAALSSFAERTRPGSGRLRFLRPAGEVARTLSECGLESNLAFVD